MNDDQAKVVRIFQYLLCKEDILKHNLALRKNNAMRKDCYAEDIISYWYAYIKLEFFKEFCDEVWNMLK